MSCISVSSSSGHGRLLEEHSGEAAQLVLLLDDGGPQAEAVSEQTHQHPRRAVQYGQAAGAGAGLQQAVGLAGGPVPTDR